MNFKPDFRKPESIMNDSYWFMFMDQKLMVISRDGCLRIPEFKDIHSINPEAYNFQYLGKYNNRQCFASEMPGSVSVPETFVFRPPLSLLSDLGEEQVRISGLANQIAHWHGRHRYCGKCGNLTEDKTDERSKICKNCGQTYYPRLSPAIIVAITKGDRILLAHAHRFPSKFYSVLAGFVEPGEDLEGCVRREIKEEVGIEIKNIKYFGSQPWPFPDSLMIAFTAEFESGEIDIDHSEIDEAGWFRANELPHVPPGISIARKLIDWFSGNNGVNLKEF